MDRNKLRKEKLRSRDELPQEQLAQKSSRIQARFLESKQLRSAKTIMSYVDFRTEVSTRQVIKECLSNSKTVAVPFTLVKESELLAVKISNPEVELQPGYCKIPEPVPALVKSSVLAPDQIDVVIVPGSVFDSQGGRLGYGGGFYDRFLSLKAPQAIRIAFAYELQLVDKVPMEEHDQFMDLIVTENKTYYCR